MLWRIKKTILFAAVLAVLVWPMLHHLAVRRWGIDSWMFFGLSMYSRPRPIIAVVDLQVATGRQPLATVGDEWLGAHPGPMQRRIGELTGELALERLAFGELFSPFETVESLFDLFPGAQRMLIRIHESALDDRGVLRTTRVDLRCARARPDTRTSCAVRTGPPL